VPELGPGTLTALLGKTAAVAVENTRRALTATALAVEREAKINAGAGGTHKYGTPTPAHPGGPPALISGTLRRSVSHTPIKPILGGFEIRVGPAGGLFPPYGKKRRTPAGRYGAYLETGLRNGATYPWLLPAFRKVAPQVRGIAFEYFKGPWPRA
jgi:hypothetical protein